MSDPLSRIVTDWSDDDALWKAMTPALSAPERFAVAEVDAAAIAGAVKLPAGAAVLDIGCGAGVHALAFAARGYVVTGVDRTASLLRLAQAQADARALQVSFVNADMREFVRPSSYDLVCSLYSSFGYFDDESNYRILENAGGSLRSGGVLVLDVIGRESLAKHWQERTWHEIARTLYLVRRSVTDDGSVLVEDWTVISEGLRKDFHTTQRIYTGAELESMLRSVGFARVDLSGSLDATPYDADARRLVAFAYMQ